MIRTALRHTLSALAVLALASAFTGAVSAQTAKLGTGQSQSGGLYGVGELANRSYAKQIAKKTRGLATKSAGSQSAPPEQKFKMHMILLQ